jgi:hypothetical protein
MLEKLSFRACEKKRSPVRPNALPADTRVAVVMKGAYTQHWLRVSSAGAAWDSAA